MDLKNKKHYQPNLRRLKCIPFWITNYPQSIMLFKDNYLAKETTQTQKQLNPTLIRSYSLIATFLASSVALMVSCSSSNLRIRDLSPPNILDEAASSFSALDCKEDSSDRRVCTVNSALERSVNAL